MKYMNYIPKWNDCPGLSPLLLQDVSWVASKKKVLSLCGEFSKQLLIFPDIITSTQENILSPLTSWVWHESTQASLQRSLPVIITKLLSLFSLLYLYIYHISLLSLLDTYLWERNCSCIDRNVLYRRAVCEFGTYFRGFSFFFTYKQTGFRNGVCWVFFFRITWISSK